MKFSLLHPTARTKAYPSFPNGWLHACWQWFQTCENPREVEYILIVHESRVEELWKQLNGSLFRKGCKVPEWGRFVIQVNHGRDCIVDQCNSGTPVATGEILIYSMDDLSAPEAWDAKIASVIPDTSELVALGCNPRQRLDLYSLPAIATRALFHRIGPLYPGYESMFSDDDWGHMLRQHGRIVEVHMEFEHRHPITNGKSEMDAVYAMQNSDHGYAKGFETFKARRAAGFPRVELPNWPGEATLAAVPVERVESPARRIVFCLPGEVFRFEWISGLIDLCGKVGEAGWQIRIVLGYSTSCYTTRMHLTRDVIEGTLTHGTPEYVFWLDDDNIIKPESFLRLLNFLDTTPTADLVAGWCWIQQADRWGTSIGNFWKEDGVHLCPMELNPLLAEGLQHKRIEHTGFPCVLMRYSVLERMGPRGFMPVTKSEIHGLLGFTPQKEVSDEWFSGEDVGFCLRAHYRYGLQMWVDPACKVAHLKTASQEPDIELFQPEVQKAWRRQVNGNPVMVPANYREVGP